MTNETKQTAVEWLVNQLGVVERNLINKTFININSKSLASKVLGDLIQQAKEMEKEQLIEARNDMQKKAIMLSNSIVKGVFIFDDKEAQKYYEKTYGGNK